jgi:DNA-binding CsgD family transcriptional regulator
MPRSPIPIKRPTPRYQPPKKLVRRKRRSRKSALELAERRQTVLTMRLKGMTFKEIGKILNIGYMTVKRDLDIIRRENLEKVTEFNQDAAVAQAMQTYDQVEFEAWKEYHLTKSPARAKYLNLIRMNNKDRIQLLVDIGFVTKAALKVEHKIETAGVIDNWTEDAKQLVAMAIIRTQMEGKNPSPLQLGDGNGEGSSKIIDVEVEDDDDDAAAGGNGA